MAFLIPGFPNELPVNAILIPYFPVDTISLPEQATFPTWGIFDEGGGPILTNEETGTSVASFTYKQDWMVADYPVEGGNFESYDKVPIPFDVRLRFVVSGSSSDISDFLGTLDNIADPAQAGLNQYFVYMPEQQFGPCNISHYDFTRTVENGIGVLIADVWLVQIREATSAGTGQDNTQQPSGADSVSGGNVNPQSPSAAQSSSAFS